MHQLGKKCHATNKTKWHALARKNDMHQLESNVMHQLG